MLLGWREKETVAPRGRWGQERRGSGILLRMILRRLLGAGLLFALIAPLVIPGLAPLSRVGPGRSVAADGAACCGSTACCAAKGACATGACDHAPPSGDGANEPAAAAPGPGPMLAATCAGPAPATVTADRDPMHFAATVALPFALASAEILAGAAAVPPLRNESPSVPPPRA